MSNYKRYTSVEIFNMALARVGVTRFISLFSDPSVEAMIGRVNYQQVLERVLEEFNWPFATKFLALTEYVPPLPTATSIPWHVAWWGGQTDPLLAPKTLPDGWGYAYSYPADCLHARAIWSGLLPDYADSRIPYRVVDNGMSGYDTVLFTNQKDAVLEYTYLPGGFEDMTRGPAGNGDLTYDVHFDDGTRVAFDDGTNLEAI